MTNRQLGFSLVELVVVIVIVGLLAAAALPRFLDVTAEAKKASVEGVAGGFATGVLSARAQWEAEARPELTIDAVARNTVNYDGVKFWLTSSASGGNFRDGYPYALNVDNTNYPVVLTDAICIDLMQNLLQNPPKVGTQVQANADSDINYSAQADNAASTCTYIQQEGSSKHQFVYEIKNGRVTVTLQ